MRIRLLGKYWRFLSVWLGPNKDGDCDHPDTPNKAIRVTTGLTPKRELSVTMHECLHATDWHKDEAWVAEVCDDIADVLIKLGWRKQ